jgi:hypothetical protein
MAETPRDPVQRDIEIVVSGARHSLTALRFHCGG